MNDDEKNDFLRQLAETYAPAARLLGVVGEGLARAVAQGIIPILAGLADFVKNLRETCPEAFDERGRLRENWQEIVQAKLATTPKHDVPKFHLDSATRDIRIYPN